METVGTISQRRITLQATTPPAMYGEPITPTLQHDSSIRVPLQLRHQSVPLRLPSRRLARASLKGMTLPRVSSDDVYGSAPRRALVQTESELPGLGPGAA